MCRRPSPAPRCSKRSPAFVRKPWSPMACVLSSSGTAAIIGFDGPAMGAPASIAIALIVAVLAAMLSAGLILTSWSWLKTYAIARPNARSSHREPTPQGGGAAVILSTFVFALGAAVVNSSLLSTSDIHQLLALTAAVAQLAVVDAIDDIRALGPLPRLLLQGIAAGVVIAALPADMRVV